MQALTFFFAFVAVLALIGVAAWLVRRFAGNRLGANTNRGRMPRLAVIDAAAVDGRRRLVLVRRDNIEHLLMIGGPTDIVVEPNIVRAMPGRDQMPQRPAVGRPDRRRGSRRCPTPAGPKRDSRAGRMAFDHAEPQMPEPPPRPVAAFICRRSAPPGAGMRNGAANLRAIAPILWPASRRSRSAAVRSPVPSRAANRCLRAHPAHRTGDAAPAAAERTRQSAAGSRSARSAPPAAAATPPPSMSTADQNLAEMAQRLEAALRRPAGDTVAPPVAPEPPPARARPRSEPPPAPAPGPKSGFENLEDEMASLLGRPKTPS